MMAKITKPIKIHGGKDSLASWIVGLMPPRCKNPNNPRPDDSGYLHYVEPYFGGGSVLLENDPEGISEVVNDINGELVNFWNVLRCPSEFELLHRFLEAAPFDQKRFDSLLRLTPGLGTCVDRAWRFFILCRQSLAGRMQGFSPVSRNRTRRGMNEQVSAWLNAIEGLPAVHARLKRVLILNGDALDVIRQQDGPRTLVYADPPYVHSSRATVGEYEHEMSEQDHAKLLLALDEMKGRFLLSGYHSRLYDNHAKTRGWRCHEKQIHNHAAGGKTKRIMTECVWCNY